MPKSLEFKIDDRNLNALIDFAKDAIKTQIIHDQVEYGIYVELGTVKMPARPALTPSFEKETKDLPKIIGQAIENAPNRGLAVINLNRVVQKVARDIEAGWKQGAAVDTGAYRNSITVTEA